MPDKEKSIPLYSCLTKGVIAEGDQLRTGPQWITARRARLKLYNQHLECGDWKILYKDIVESVLSSFRSPLLRIPGYVLSIRTAEQSYHFGLNGGKFWKGPLPFPVEKQQSKLQMSRISILARSILIGYLLYFLWRWVVK